MSQHCDTEADVAAAESFRNVLLLNIRLTFSLNLAGENRIKKNFGFLRLTGKTKRDWAGKKRWVGRKNLTRLPVEGLHQDCPAHSDAAIT
jgi:hypothetical protein